MDKDRDSQLTRGHPEKESGVSKGGVPTPPSAVEPGEGALKESKLIAFGERITYTFVWAKEVHSIHFDRKREEIFYRGHNIRNLELAQEQAQLLIHFKTVLARDQGAHSFLIPYERILQKLLREKGYTAKV